MVKIQQKYFFVQRGKYTALITVPRMAWVASGSSTVYCGETAQAWHLQLQSFIKAKIILWREESNISNVPVRMSLQSLVCPDAYP